MSLIPFAFRFAFVSRLFFVYRLRIVSRQALPPCLTKLESKASGVHVVLRAAFFYLEHIQPVSPFCVRSIRLSLCTVIFSSLIRRCNLAVIASSLIRRSNLAVIASSSTRLSVLTFVALSSFLHSLSTPISSSVDFTSQSSAVCSSRAQHD